MHQPLVIEVEPLAGRYLQQLRPMLYRDRLSILPRRNRSCGLDAEMISKSSRSAEFFDDFWNTLHAADYA